MASSTPIKTNVNDNVDNGQASQGLNDRSNNRVANTNANGATDASTTNEHTPNNPHRRPVRQPLTQANLAAHDAHRAALPHGPSPMQRWWMSTDDLIVRGRRTERASQDDLTRYIDRMFATAEKEKKNGGK